MDQPSPEDYKDILTEIIKKQAVILGPQIAVLKARNVAGITVSDDGIVSKIDADSNIALQQLIDQYVSLSGEIVKNAVNSVFAKYPSLKR
jgi:hypothetical protein